MVGDMKQAIYGVPHGQTGDLPGKIPDVHPGGQRQPAHRSEPEFPQPPGSAGYGKLYFPADHGKGSGRSGLRPGTRPCIPERFIRRTAPCGTELLLLDKKSPEFQEDSSKTARQEAGSPGGGAETPGPGGTDAGGRTKRPGSCGRSAGGTA